MNHRIIHTELYSPKALNTLQKIFKYLSDNWGSNQMSRNMGITKLEVQPNGEITIDINTEVYRYNYMSFRRMSDMEIKRWFALNIRQIALREISFDDLQPSTWSRDSHEIGRHFKDDDSAKNVTFQDLYFIYDILIGNKLSKHWKNKKKYLEDMLGKERDPIATELELARREELKKIDEKYQKEASELSKKMYDKLRESEAAIRAMFNKQQDELKSNYKKAVKDLEESMNFMTVAENSGLI